jgi:hypothetical protein
MKEKENEMQVCLNRRGEMELVGSLPRVTMLHLVLMMGSTMVNRYNDIQ